MRSIDIFLSLLLLTATGCPKSSTSDAGSVASSDPIDAAASVAPAASAAAASPSTSTPVGVAPAFLKLTPIPSGPIAVTGYPHPIRMGMNDPARWAGFSKDGTLFGYCAEGGGIASTSCAFTDAAGKITTMASSEGDETPAEKAKRKAIDKFMASHGIPMLNLEGDSLKAIPPAMTGTWPFTDITVDVALGESIGGKDGKETSATIQVGGTVKGDTSPVHPITLGSPVAAMSPANFVAMNVLSLGPGGTDIGMVGTFFAGEYSDAFTVKRLPAASFASLVYNDAGFRHHQKSDFVRSATLFAKAVGADPNAKLPPYNLACAWARLKDPRTKDALAFAIARDPSVKTRAKKDKDFDAVKSEPWFTDLTK